MTDLEPILALWHELRDAGREYVLATVVAVEGPSYRKPGARMLLGSDGRRAGTVSGGCLEAEIARRAWWLTDAGPSLEWYSTAPDDEDRPYGSGCGGSVQILLERMTTADSVLSALEAAFHARAALAIATVISGPQTGRRAFAGTSTPSSDAATDAPLIHIASQTLQNLTSGQMRCELEMGLARVYAEYCAPRPGLWIFGAGDDAKPLLALAEQLGWYVVIADGRSHLANTSRFPQADLIQTLAIQDLPGTSSSIPVQSADAAVVMTHSFDQDAHILAALLTMQPAPRYMGVLGPQQRTRELLMKAALLRGFSANDDQVERELAALHAPMGLDLGGETPADIALSILAEIQQTLSNATALPLRTVRRDVPVALR